MKGSLIVVGFFALGCLLGWSGYLPGVGSFSSVIKMEDNE